MVSYKLFFREIALHELGQIPKNIAQRIVRKLEWYCAQEDSLVFAKPLKGFRDVYRFRVGEYRILFDCHDGMIDVYSIGHRSSVYR